jgi:hypothetical protein
MDSDEKSDSIPTGDIRFFDKLYGGAYPWHGKEDNVCRLNGYTEDKIPQARGAKVIAPSGNTFLTGPKKSLFGKHLMEKDLYLPLEVAVFRPGKLSFSDTGTIHRKLFRYMKGNKAEVP